MDRVMPMFPLGIAYVPGDVVSLRLFEPRYLSMMRDILQADVMEFGSVLIMAGSEVGGGDRRASVGSLVEVDDCAVTDEGGYVLVGHATSVFDVTAWLPDDPYPMAAVEVRPREDVSARDLAAHERAMSQIAQRIRLLLVERVVLPHALDTALKTIASGQHWTAQDSSQVEEALWGLVRCVPCGPVDRLAMLSAGGLEERMVLLGQIVEHIREVLDFQDEAGRA